MATDFKVNIDVDADTSAAEKKISDLTKSDKKIKIKADVDGSKNVDGLATSVDKATHSVKNLDSSFKSISMAKIKYDVFREIQQKCKNAVESVSELNKAMTLVNMTMLDMPQSSLKSLSNQSIQIAKDLSTYTKTVTDAVTIYANANESAASILNKTQPTVLLASASGMSASNAADSIQGIMNQFNMAEDQAMHIADSIEKLSSEISLDFSKGISTISDAVSVGGSVMNEAGLSFEKYGAIVAATAEQTRLSGSVLGNAFKTIASRITRSKSGEATEEDRANAEKALNSIGVSARGADGDFQDLSITLDSIGAKWGSLTQAQKSYIAEESAGIRNKNAFIAMMNTYNRALDLEKKAVDSSGTAMKINEKRMDSIDGKMQKLSATMTEMYNDAIPEEVIKGMVDFATAVVKVVDNFGLLRGAIAAVGTFEIGNVIGKIFANWSKLAAFFTNPVTIGAGVVGGVVAIASAYQKSVDDMVQSAKQAGDAWEESNASIDDNIAKVAELRTALDSGTLTEQEAYDAKSQLLEIQSALSESYGNQISGLDLVNGKYDEQIAKLKELNEAQSERFLAENREGIKYAKKKMEESQQYELGEVWTNSAEAKGIKDIVDKYSGTGLYGVEANGVYTIKFEGDATQANEVLQNFSTDVKAFQQEVESSGITELILDKTSDALNDSKSILEDYQDLYNQAMKADVQTNKKDYGGKTAIEWLNNYAKAVENYNNAVASGSAEEVANAKIYYNYINRSVQSQLDNTDMSQYSALFTDVSDQLDKASIKANEFNSALNVDSEQYQYLNGYQKHLRSVAEEIKNLDMSDVDFMAAVNTGDIDSINYLNQAAQEAGVSTDDLAQSLVDLGALSGKPSSAVEQVSTSIESISDSADLVLSQIEAVNNALSSQSTGQSIDIESFNSDELKDYQSALEYVNGTMQLNTVKVRELQKAKAEEAIATNDAAKAQLQSDYLKQVAQIEELRDKLHEKNLTEGETAESIQNSIDSLLASNDAIASQCAQLDILNASLREATGAYQEWLNSQNTSESGDMFDDSLNAIQAIRDTADTESDAYGKIGTKKYEAAVDFVIPETIDREDTGAVQSYLDSIEKYFTHNDKGSRTGLDLDTFLNSAVRNGLMTVDESGTDYQLAGQMTMEKFAEGMDMSLPMVQAFFGELQEYGGKFDWSDEAIQTVGDLGIKANEAAESLRNIDGNQDFKINMDVSDIDTVEGQISALDGTIAEMNTIKAKPGVDVSEIENANAVIQYCVAQQQLLSAPAVMSVDTSQVKGSIGNAISLLQQFQAAQNTVDMQASIGADTSEAQAEVDGLVSEIQGLSPDIKAKLSIDSTSATTITASLQGLTPEVMVKYGVNQDAILGYNPDNKDATVVYDKDSSVPDGYTPSDKNATVIYGINHSAVDGYDPPNLNRTVTYTVTTSDSPPSGGSGGTGGLNGTAHVSGTAMAGGNWGAKQGGRTLVGELGREIMVDPYTGKWRTIGDNGAEFVDVPKGAIVFNHKQSEALLERGWVNGRGTTALASGTAMVTGGINISHLRPSNGSSNSSSNSAAINQSTQAHRENASAVQASTNAAKDNTEAFDWVKRNLDKLSRTFERYANQINDYISSSLKISLLKKQLSTIDKQLKANQRGYDTYMAKANSINISKEYKNRVKNGTFKIEDIDTSTDAGKKLAENIRKYQEYYDAAMDCRDAIIDLNNRQLELYETLANMPTERAENKIEKLKRKYESLSAVSSAISSGGSAIAALTNQINADNPKLKNAKANVTKAETARNATKAQTTKASKSLKVAKADTKESATDLTKAAKKQTSNSAKSLKNAAKSSTDKATYNAISKAIREGKPVSTKGLKGEALKYAKSYNSSLKQQNAIAKAVSSGKKVSTSGLSKVLKAEAAQYNQDVKDQATAQSAYDKAKEADKKALEKLNKAKATKDEVYSQTTREQQTLATNKNPKAYVVQNTLLDQELSLLKQENTARQTALKQTTAETKKQQAAYNKAVASRDKSQKNLLSDKKVTSSLNKTQLAALKAGKTVSTKGITDPAVLKKIEAYNKKVSTASDANKKLNIQLEAQANAVNNAAQAEAEYAQALVDNEKQKLENISNYYDSMMTEFENRSNLIQAYMNRMETRGYNLSESFYNAQIANQKSIVANQEAELAAMQKSFQDAINSGAIKVGTQEYNEMKDTIDQLILSIAEGENNIISLQDSIRALRWEQFNRLQESIKRVANESSFLIDLLSSKELYDKDTGLLTDEGWATMGLHGVNYNTYMKQADNYKQEMLRISAELANDPNNQTLIDRKNELIDAQQQAILSAENEKKSIRDMVENGINAELDAIDDLIDKYLDLLSAKKDLYDFEKKTKKQAEEIASLQKQLAVYQNDNSEEAKAKVQEIKLSLKEAQDDLKESEYDKFISDQKELLDDLRNDYEEVLNKRLDNIDVLIQASIDQINANAENIQQTLIAQADKVGYTLTPEMKNIWTTTGNIKDVLSTYSSDFGNKSTTLNNTMSNIWKRQKDMIDALNASANTIVAAINSTTQAPNSGQTTKAISTKGYASGGYVNKDQWATMNEHGQELIEYDGGFLVPLPKTADIWNAPETKALLNELSNPQPLFIGDYASQFAKSLQNVGGGNGDGQSDTTHIDTLNVSLPNVTDPEDFINHLIKSKRFEKLIGTMTVDRITGRGTSLSKYKLIKK